MERKDMLECVAELAALAAEQPPVFADNYSGRGWDAAQFRVHGPTKGDHLAGWLASRGAEKRSISGPLCAAVWAAWGVSSTIGMGPNGALIDAIVERACRAYHGGARSEEAIINACADLNPRPALEATRARENALCADMRQLVDALRAAGIHLDQLAAGIEAWQAGRILRGFDNDIRYSHDTAMSRAFSRVMWSSPAELVRALRDVE